MKDYALINSKLYPALLNKGGDRLVAFFAHLKVAKNQKDRIRPIDSKKHYNLIRKVTGFSKPTCKKYFDKLIEIGVANFSKDGSVYLIGNNKAQKEYENKAWVAIQIKESLAKTALGSYAVRVRAEEKKQITRIDNKQSQIKLLARVNQGLHVSHQQHDLYKRIVGNEKVQEGLSNFCNKTVLSREGFAKLKDESLHNKDKGRYWRNKLIKEDMLKIRRNNKFIKRCTLTEFAIIKEAENNPRLNWYKGAMYEETVCEFTTSNFLTPSSRVPEVSEELKKYGNAKDYLDIDMIHFWLTAER